MSYPFHTLPNLLAPGLRLVFVGINPSVYAAERGHYFARKTNRFWPALSRSRLSAPIRAALGRATLVPEDDVLLPDFGIGFTDVVKRPTPNASGLTPEDYRTWAPHLFANLDRYQPAVACFHGVVGYRAFLKYALGAEEKELQLGPQSRTLGQTRVFLVPNPSPANAHFRLEDQIHWDDKLAEYLEEEGFSKHG